MWKKDNATTAIEMIAAIDATLIDMNVAATIDRKAPRNAETTVFVVPFSLHAVKNFLKIFIILDCKNILDYTPSCAWSIVKFVVF